jgi:hypothetical protein
LIEKLASLCGMRVCEFNSIYLNIRRNSTYFEGYNPADLCNFQRMGESGSVVIIGW